MTAAAETQELKYGYAGKILRINLTDRTTDTLPTAKYAFDYIGGRAIATRIFWDEVRGDIDPFSPDNKLILMTGAAGGTGLPVSSRCVMVGVSANNIPSQFAYSGIGGIFGSALKYAGYDGFILEGKADEHVYVLIEDGKVSFCDATDIWGGLVCDTQNELERRHGGDAQSLVIGPAGENLVRFASITTNNDNTAAKCGFGAVMGSKNVKAITVRGTGTVAVPDPKKVLELRTNPSHTAFHLNKIDPAWMDAPGTSVASMTHQTCCMGCVDHCATCKLDVKSPFEGDDSVFSMVQKCTDIMAYMYDDDCYILNGSFHMDPEQEKPGQWRWWQPSISNPDTPNAKWMQMMYPADHYGLWKDTEFGDTLLWLCNQYGIDKWEAIMGIYAWLAMLRNEGLLDFDLGFEGDPCTGENCRKLMHDIAFREGIGKILGEGTARATRILGKQKYGDSIYHGRTNGVTGERLDIPVSLEACWGQVSHWLGRGFQGCDKPSWLIFGAGWMLGSRDVSAGQHFHNEVDEYMKYKDDPCHSDYFAWSIIRNIDRCMVKDTAVSCDFRSPNPTWPTMEAELYSAATGLEMTRDRMYDVAHKLRLLERAILMRNSGRCRDMEVEAMFPWFTWPDPWGATVTWDEWNDLTDKLYDLQGFDRATGWPTRSAWESVDLGDVADELEGLGMLPPEDGTPGYVRKACPFPEHDCPVGERPEEIVPHEDAITHYWSSEDPRMIAFMNLPEVEPISAA